LNILSQKKAHILRKIFLYDKFAIGDKLRLDSFGFLHVDNVIIARTGIQHYLESEIFKDGDPTKIIGVARLKKDILDSGSIKTFKNIPLTDSHPNEFVTSRNFSKYQKGSISKVEPKDDKYLLTDITINDEKLIGKVKKGKVELSVGYSTVLIAEDGELNGEKYSYRQTEIIANHLAVVEHGRCGAKCSLISDDGSLVKLNKRNKMKKVKITIGDKSTEVEVADEVASYIDMQTAEIEVLKKELSDSKDREANILKDAIAEVNAKAELLKFASERGIKVDKTLGIFEIKKVIAKGLGVDVDGKSEAYLDGVIETSKKYGKKVSDEKKKIDDKKLDDKKGSSAWEALIVDGGK
jgi:hypothetical protein